MYKLKSAFGRTQGIIFLALQCIGIISVKDMPKKLMKTQPLDNFAEKQNNSSMYSGTKIRIRKSAKPIRIINNYSNEISIVELKKGNVHIKLVPLSPLDQQKKRVSGYRYLTV